MNAARRKSVSLIMSLVLMVFSICQAQAMAAALPVPAAPDTTVAAGMAADRDMAEMADCHGSQPADPTVMNCHSVCQHLQQHNDVAKKLPQTDVTPVLLALLMPHELTGTAALSPIYTPPDPLSASPPPLLRFQRFLE